MRQTVSKDEAGSGLFEKPVLEKVYLTHPLTNKRANTKSNGKVNELQRDERRRNVQLRKSEPTTSDNEWIVTRV